MNYKKDDLLYTFHILLFLIIAIQPYVSENIQRLNHDKGNRLSRKTRLVPFKSTANNTDDDRPVLHATGGIAVDVSSYPFTIALRENNRYICGGVILSPDKIISTAHCFRHRLYTVHAARSKKYGIEPTEQVFKITKILVHPGYDRRTYDNDLVIVKLNATIKLGPLAMKAYMPTFNQVLPPDSFCCMVGFGDTLGYGHPNLLNEGCFPSWRHEKCNHRDYYGGRISSNMICAGEDSGGTDACRGDSGGPLYCTVDEEKLVWGLVSWGVGCAEANKPGVYVNLAKYTKWIQQNSRM